MFFQTSILTNTLNNLRGFDGLNSYFLMQQNSEILRNKIYYSIGLVIVCLSILILLWLPDLLKGKRN